MKKLVIVLMIVGAAGWALKARSRAAQPPVSAGSTVERQQRRAATFDDYRRALRSGDPARIAETEAAYLAAKDAAE